MKQILKLSAAPAAILGAAAFFATATPAAATDYCRTEVTAGTRGLRLHQSAAMPDDVFRARRHLRR
jgi:hypothetical protein